MWRKMRENWEQKMKKGKEDELANEEEKEKEKIRGPEGRHK